MSNETLYRDLLYWTEQVKAALIENDAEMLESALERLIMKAQVGRGYARHLREGTHT